MYERLSGYQVVTVWPLVYIVAGALETLWFWRHDADKETGRHLLIFTVMGCVSTLLGTLIYGISTWPLLAFDIVYLYLNVQSRREQEINILAFKDTHYADVFQVADHRMYENKIWVKSQKKGEL